MGNFIGAAGGLLIVLLIFVLLWRFMLDIGVVKDEKVIKRVKFTTIGAIGFGIMQLLIGSLIVNFLGGPISALDIAKIWNVEPVAGMLADNSKYSFKMLTDSGIFPLYPVIVSVFSGLLYNMYVECALYISFISGVVFYVCMGGFFNIKYDGDAGNRSLAILFCFPGSFFLFLPCSFSLFAALFAATLLALEGKHKVLSAILVILCCLTHICGLVAVALFVYRLISGDDYRERNLIKIIIITCVQLLLIVVCIQSGWCKAAERWFLLSVPATMYLGNCKFIKGDEIYKWIMVIEVLFSGFYMVGKLYNVF